MGSYRRELALDLPAGQSAFLWGPRKTGKSTLLAERFPDSARFDLLEKLKRDGANLLGGRAWRFALHPLAWPEIPGFNLLRAVDQRLRAFCEEHTPRRAVVVSQDPAPRRAGIIDVLPWNVFLERL